MKKRWYRGSITVFLSLIAAVFLALICTVLESIRIEGAKVRGAACMDLGLFSIFGEYERDLFSEYHILFFDGSYGTGNLSEEKMEARLKFFLNKNADVREKGSEIDWFRVQNIQTDVKEYFLATDEGGKAFSDQALLFMEGLEKTEQRDPVQKETKQIEEKMQILNQKKKQLRNLWGGIPQKEIFAFDPISWLDTYQEKNVFSQVIPSSFSISAHETKRLEKVSERSKNEGNMAIPDGKKNEKEIFKNYLFLTFGNALEQKDRKGLLYEIEYVLGGYKSDKQNLEFVCRELLNVRWADNFSCIIQDPEKRKEVEKRIQDTRKKREAEKKKEEKEEIEKEIQKDDAGKEKEDKKELEKTDKTITEMILLEWSYQESLNDVKKLFSGGCVPFQKRSQDWEVQSAESGKTDNGAKAQKAEDGWNYEDYLWLLLEKNQILDLPMKALDLIEWEMKKCEGTEYFCADCCVGGIAAEAVWQIEPVFFKIASAFSGISSQTVQYSTKGIFFYGMGE
ncbi:MAG: DUF5702 domain-containing protein [Eubacteriales bacterium]|nr:DUF5702 domain-containing protein [Eubacteriales bacterium]